MRPSATFVIIWDSGASHSISHCKNDFVGEIKSPGVLKRLSGLAKGLDIAGVGEVLWTFIDTDGKFRHVKVPAYYIPKSPVRLLSTTSLLQTYSGETICLSDQSALLSGIPSDPERTPVEAFVNSKTNIPTATAFRFDEVHQTAVAFNATVSEVHSANMNLTEPEKELLRWHQRLGHLSFRTIQFLMRSGVLCLSASKRHLHTAAAKLPHPPKCAACMFGKQKARSIPGNKSTAVKDVAGNLKNPGEASMFPKIIRAVVLSQTRPPV